jgi:hypothetical protein
VRLLGVRLAMDGRSDLEDLLLCGVGVDVAFTGGDCGVGCRCSATGWRGGFMFGSGRSGISGRVGRVSCGEAVVQLSSLDLGEGLAGVVEPYSGVLADVNKPKMRRKQIKCAYLLEAG